MVNWRTMTKSYSRKYLDARITELASDIKDLSERESQGENVSEEKIKKMGESWAYCCMRATLVHNQIKEEASLLISSDDTN